MEDNSISKTRTNRGKKEQLYICRMSICDVIEMLEWHHHVASQRIQNFLEAFFMFFFFQYKMRYLVVSKTKNPIYSCEDGIEKAVSDANRWSSWRIFLSHPHIHDGFLLSRDMRFPTMWYVRPAKAQTSLRIRAVWSEPLLVACIFYECKSTDWTSFGVSKLKRRLHRLVYTCQNATLLEITRRGSIIITVFGYHPKYQPKTLS